MQISKSIGHLEHACVIGGRLLDRYHEGCRFRDLDAGSQVDSLDSSNRLTASSVSGLDDLYGAPMREDSRTYDATGRSSATFGNNSSDTLDDLYGVPVRERNITQTSLPSIASSSNLSSSSKPQSPLVSWLFLVRYAVSIQVHDFRADLTLSHSFNRAKAEVLGTGATFVVRRWVRDRGDADLAIKTIRRCGPTEEDRILKAVGVEMKALTDPSLASNEFIVRLEAVDWEVRAGYQNPLPILITQFADYGDLAGYQRQLLSLSFETKINLCLDVALGIRALHANGFIHGDIKSENVLLFRHPKRGITAKLSDFAFSILPSRREEKLRLSGITFPYNAPELDGRNAHRELDFKGLALADIYSFGLLVWRTMLNGRNPFQLENHSAPLEPGSIIQIKQTETELLQAAYDSIERCEMDLITDIVRPVLRSTLQVDPKKRDILAAINSLSAGCERSQSITTLPYLNTQYKPPWRSATSLDELPEKTTKEDHLFCLAFEELLNNVTPIFMSFHPVDKMNALVQKHILSAFEELAAEAPEEISTAIKIFLLFVYISGFGHASPANNMEKVKKYYGESSMGIIKSLVEGSEEDRAKAVYCTISGAMNEIFPFTDASTFFLQVMDVLTNGNESRSMVFYRGLTQNADNCSPIAKSLLQKHLPDVFEAIGWRRYDEVIDEQHTDFLVMPLHASPALSKIKDRHPGAFAEAEYEFEELGTVARGGDTYLHLAAKYGYTSVVKSLIQQVPDDDFLNLPNNHVETPLFKAAQGGNADICRHLLKCGAQPKENIFNQTPLHWVSSFSKKVDIEFLVKQFVDRGADIAQYGGCVSDLMMDTHSQAGTPLERAVSRNNPVAVQVILDVGRNNNLLVTEKAVHTAATYHFSECLEILLKAKPQMKSSTFNLRNLIGSAILGAPKWHWYHWHGRSHVHAAIKTLDVLLNAQVTTRTVASYVPFRQKFRCKLSAMGAAAVVGADHMINHLASHGIPVETEGQKSQYEQESPPLYEALSRGYFEATQALLKNGADPNTRWLMVGGETYLHLCAYYHWDIKFVRLLIEEYSADINLEGYDGRTPLYTALLAENYAFVDYLLDRGGLARTPRAEGPDGYSLFGEFLGHTPDISDKQLEYALSISSGEFQVFPRAQATALHFVCSSRILFKGEGDVFRSIDEDEYLQLDERRILRFVLSRFSSPEHINAKTIDGETALQLATRTGNTVAVQLLLETGVVDEEDIKQTFMTTIVHLCDAAPEEIVMAGKISRYRERFQRMAKFLRAHLPQSEYMMLPLNAYTSRPAADRNSCPAEKLPARRRYISAQKYCAIARYPTVRIVLPSDPKPADYNSFLEYVRGIGHELSEILPKKSSNDPEQAEITDEIIWRARKVLWETLDIDWVVLVQDADGIGFRSPSERLQIMQLALEMVLALCCNNNLEIKLKLAGNKRKLELLFLLDDPSDDNNDYENEDDDGDDSYERESLAWMPPFELGRDHEQLAEWERFLREIKTETETSLRGFMVGTVDEDPEKTWRREVERVEEAEGSYSGMNIDPNFGVFMERLRLLALSQATLEVDRAELLRDRW